MSQIFSKIFLSFSCEFWPLCSCTQLLFKNTSIRSGSETTFTWNEWVSTSNHISKVQSAILSFFWHMYNLICDLVSKAPPVNKIYKPNIFTFDFAYRSRRRIPRPRHTTEGEVLCQMAPHHLVQPAPRHQASGLWLAEAGHVQPQFKDRPPGGVRHGGEFLQQPPEDAGDDRPSHLILSAVGQGRRSGGGVRCPLPG